MDRFLILFMTFSLVDFCTRTTCLFSLAGAAAGAAVESWSVA